MKRRVPLGLALGLALAVSAQAQRLSFSLSAGIFSPGQEMYREIYGPGVPLSFEGWLDFGSGFGLSAGVTRLRDSGLAVAVSGGGEEYPLKFERVSIPLTLFFVLRTGGTILRLGAGLAYHSYRESWQTVDLGFEGTKFAPRLSAAFEAPVLGRVSLLFSLAHESIATGIPSPTGRNVTLGGFQVLGGLSFRVR